MFRDAASGHEYRLKRFSFLVLATVLCLPILLASCSRTDPVVKIGLVAPFEGRHRDIGYDVIYSARLAIRQANAARNQGDVRFSLVAVDDFGDPAMAQETASAMVVDGDIVAVVGHWLPETTQAASEIYAAGGLPFVEAGEGMLGASDPAQLSEPFLSSYSAVTPFDETAGPYAGAGYDGVQLIIAAVTALESSDREVNRENVGEALRDVSYNGTTGPVSVP